MTARHRRGKVVMTAILPGAARRALEAEHATHCVNPEVYRWRKQR